MAKDQEALREALGGWEIKFRSVKRMDEAGRAGARGEPAGGRDTRVAFAPVRWMSRRSRRAFVRLARDAACIRLAARKSERESLDAGPDRPHVMSGCPCARNVLRGIRLGGAVARAARRSAAARRSDASMRKEVGMYGRPPPFPGTTPNAVAASSCARLSWSVGTMRR